MRVRSTLLSRLILPLTLAAIASLAPAQALVEGWGLNHLGQRTVPLLQQRGLIQVNAGGYHGLGLKEDGTVIAWGSNSSGQTNVPSGLAGVVQVAAGGSFSLALKSDGTVVAWGANDSGQINVPAGLTNVVKIAAGTASSLALKSDGTVIGWGSNSWGQLNIPAGLNNVVNIEEGGLTGAALKADGTLVTWGYAAAQPASPLTGISNVAIGDTDGSAVRSDGTVANFGVNGFAAPSGLNNVVQVAAAQLSQAALKSDGTCVAWGYNYNTELNIPSDLNGVISISGGALHYLALRAVGVVLDQSEVQGGDAATGTVTLPIAPGSGGADVALSSSDTVVKVPAYVHVDAGSHTATFPVTTDLVFQDRTITVQAIYNGVKSTFDLKIKGTGVALALSTSSIVPGSTTRLIGTLTLASTATVNTTLNLASSSAQVTVPTTVTVPAGATQVAFDIAHTPVTADGQVVISAKVAGTDVAQVTLQANYIRASVGFDTPDLTAGDSAIGVVTLAKTVQRAQTVSLVSSDPGVTVPATVTVKAGSRIALFPVSTASRARSASVRITATVNGNTFHANLDVSALPTLRDVVIKPTVYGNARLTGTVRLMQAAPEGGQTVTLASSSPGLTVPSTVLVPAGQTSATFNIAAADVAVTTDATVTATLETGSVSDTVTIVPLTIASFSGSVTSVMGTAPISLTVRLNAVAGVDTVVQLSSADGALIPLPSSVTVPAGSQSVTFTVTTGFCNRNTTVSLAAIKGAQTVTRNVRMIKTVAS